MLMRAMPLFLLPLLGVLTTSEVAAADRGKSIRVSVGGSWQARNDVRIPNTAEGSRFSLKDAAGTGPVLFTRAELNWMINERHGLRVVLAPLSYTETVSFDQTVRFAGGSFDPGVATDASYRFNSWRIGYHYLLRESGSTSLRIGGTLKVRDAEIRLQQGANVQFDDDLGLVPLLYLAGQYQLSDRVAVGADLDALAGGPGRAIDLGVTLELSVTPRWRIGAELRVLDGGADTDTVYNFARFNTAALTIRAAF